MVVGPAGSLRGALAVRAVTDAGEVPLCISGPRLAAEPDAARRLRLASREVTLTGRVLLMLDTDLLAELPAVFAVLDRSEEHTSELQSLMRISYALFCLKKKIKAA